MVLPEKMTPGGAPVNGPFAGMLLADLGAEVIKIEHPHGGDMTRQTGPFVQGESSGFMALNRNKKSVTLNLKDPAGREVFADLVARADVVVENFSRGTADRLGVGFAAARAANPRIVYC